MAIHIYIYRREASGRWLFDAVDGADSVLTPHGADLEISLQETSEFVAIGHQVPHNYRGRPPPVAEAIQNSIARNAPVPAASAQPTETYDRRTLVNSGTLPFRMPVRSFR